MSCSWHVQIDLVSSYTFDRSSIRISGCLIIKPPKSLEWLTEWGINGRAKPVVPETWHFWTKHFSKGDGFYCIVCQKVLEMALPCWSTWRRIFHDVAGSRFNSGSRKRITWTLDPIDRISNFTPGDCQELDNAGEQDLKADISSLLLL